MKGQIIIMIVIVLHLVSCNAPRRNNQSLELINSGDLNISLDSIAIFKGLPFAKINDTFCYYYISKKNNYLLRKGINYAMYDTIYKFTDDEIDGLKYYKINSDTLIFEFEDNVMKVLKGDKGFILNLNLPENLFPKSSIYSPIDYFDNKLLFQYGIDDNNLFIDTLSHIEMSIDNGKIIDTKKIIPYPAKYRKVPYYFKEYFRIWKADKLYFYTQKTDSLFDKNGNLTPLFTDRKFGNEALYDISKATDMNYLMHYIDTSRINIATFQDTNASHTYIIKRLSKKKKKDPNVYILGVVGKGEFIKTIDLPSDFNDLLHYFFDKDFFYFSTTEYKWKHYRLKF